MSHPSISNITPGEILSFALRHENYDEIVELIQHSMRSQDKWIVNSCILAVEYLAMDFGKYPKDIKDFLWARAGEFPNFDSIKGTIWTAEQTIEETDAVPT